MRFLRRMILCAPEGDTGSGGAAAPEAPAAQPDMGAVLAQLQQLAQGMNGVNARFTELETKIQQPPANNTTQVDDDHLDPEVKALKLAVQGSMSEQQRLRDQLDQRDFQTILGQLSSAGKKPDDQTIKLASEIYGGWVKQCAATGQPLPPRSLALTQAMGQMTFQQATTPNVEEQARIAEGSRMDMNALAELSRPGSRLVRIPDTVPFGTDKWEQLPPQERLKHWEGPGGILDANGTW